MSPAEREEIRNFVHGELAEIEYRCAHNAGSFNYFCSLGGLTFFSHRPVGDVIRQIHHPMK